RRRVWARPTAWSAEMRSAVDVEDMPGQEARVVRREEQRHRRDVLLGIAEPADRPLGHGTCEPLRVALHELEPALRGGRRIDHVHGDAMLAPLARGDA